MQKKISLNDAVKFHGHLGPYLVLGLLAGDLALKQLKAKKYFGIRVKVWGAVDKPKSCLIDGLQLSTGATYGKGNIEKLSASQIEMEFTETESGNKLFLTLNTDLAQKIGMLISCKDSEKFAKKLFTIDCGKIFYWRLSLVDKS